jgi:hypothetical protein
MFTTNSFFLIICQSISGIYFFKFLKLICLLSPFEKFHHSLFYLFILFYDYRTIVYCWRVLTLRILLQCYNFNSHKYLHVPRRHQLVSLTTNRWKSCFVRGNFNSWFCSFTAVVLKIKMCRDMTPCRRVNTYRHVIAFLFREKLYEKWLIGLLCLLDLEY